MNENLSSQKKQQAERMNENCWRWAEKSSEFDRGLSVVFIASPLTTRPNSIYHDFHILVTAFLIGLAAAAYTHGPHWWAPFARERD